MVGGSVSVDEPALPPSLSVSFSFSMCLLGFFFLNNVNIAVLEGLGQSMSSKS